MSKEQQENKHEFQDESLSNEILSSMIENNTETNLLNNIEKQIVQISPSFSSIPYIDSLTSLDNQNLSEKNQSSLNLSRQISLTEIDLISSLDRNLNKQIIDNSSDDDDILFLEWDKERNLFQNYINSLRKEIRVLLQERLEYREKLPHDNQMKIDLLQKSLEEKNFILEQLQTDYDKIKEQNNNLIRKISLIQHDTKSYLTIIDQLKEKITDLTIDLQNHILIKRRLEISIQNLENDCQILDTERLRITHDLKENLHNKQDLEKLLQKANVQIAEQGSTIEKLRSENVQVRSQLSTIQRRMFQEKQQIMDYLRQIENDLIEKEQIKQRELLLREDYEQLKKSLNKDQEKIENLKKESLQLLQIIENQNKEKQQFQLDIEHLYSHFHIPIESHNRSQLSLQPIENYFNDLQKISTNQITDNDKLQENLILLTTQCAQLDEANRAWQQYHQIELENFRIKLQNILPIENLLSYDEIAQSILNYFNEHNNNNPESKLSSKQINLTPIEEVPIHTLTSTQSTPSLINEYDEELHQLRNKCNQLDQANRAWQEYQQIQYDTFKNKFQDYLPLNENLSFDQIVQFILNKINKDREEFEQINDDLQSKLTTNLEIIKQSYINTIDELNREIMILKEELDKRILSDQENISITILKKQLGNYLSIDNNNSSNEIIQQIIDEIVKQQKISQELEKSNDNLRLESENNLQSYLNIINELKQELFVLKEHSISSIDKSHLIYDQLKTILLISSESSFEDIILSIKNLIKDKHFYQEKQEILTKNLQSINQQLIDVYHQCEQLEQSNKNLLLEKQSITDQIQKDYFILQNQCTQLDHANQAWQEFYEKQIDLIKNQFKDYIDFDEKLDFNQIIQIIAKEYQQKTNSSSNSTDRSSEISSDTQEIQTLENQLKSNQFEIDLLKTNLQIITNENKQLKQQYDEIETKYNLLIKTNQNLSIEEIQQLQINLSLLKTQCSQLNETNQTWQEFHRNQLEFLHEKFHNHILFNSNSTFEDILEQILNKLSNYHNNELILKQNLQELQLLKDQYQILENLNKELILKNENFNDQSISFDHHSPIKQLINNQYKSIEQNHMTIETIPFNYQNNQTQTDLFTSIFDDENFLNINDNNEYINDISSRTSMECFNELNEQCKQILSQQNIDISNFDLNQLALITIHSLFNQHLINQAKQLYNETIIRALKQEYQLINNEKNHLIQQELPLENNNNNNNNNILQIIRNKIDQLINLRPDLYPHSTDDIIERFDQFISVIQNQTKQIDQFQQDLFEKEEQRILLQDHLNKVQFELRKTLDNQTSITDRFQALLDEQNLQSIKLEQEIAQLKQINISSDNNIQSLKKTIEQQSEELKDLSEKYLSQMELQDEINRQKKEINEQLIDYKNQMDNLIQERANLLEEIEKKTKSSIETIDNESQTDDRQHEKLIQINNKLKRVLQTFKDKIHRIIMERPDLFKNIADETSERLDHFILTLENQAIQIKELQTERDQIEEQLRNEIKRLQSDFEMNENERREQIKQLSFQYKDYQKQIEQLQQNLSEKENERNSFSERVHELEIELKKTIDEHATKMMKYNSFLEQGPHHSVEIQTDIHQIDEKLVEPKQSPDYHNVQTETNEDIEIFYKIIEQQSEQLKNLNEKNAILLSQLESKEEIEKQLNECNIQIENLIQEREKLIEEIEKKTVPSIQTTDNETQTDNRQHEKLVQMNTKLKRLLQAFKDKIHRTVIERPDLFEGVGEETNERLDRLISIIENQTTQLNALEVERNQVDEKYQNQIKELQSSLEAYQYELDDERQKKIEQLTSASLLSSPLMEEVSSSIVEDYEKQIKQLQQNLSENEEERILLREHLNKVEIELRKALDDHASTLNKYKSLEQEAHHSEQSQHEIQQLKEELAELRQTSDYQHAEIQTDEDMKALDEITKQLKDLNEKNAALSFQLESQTEIDKQKKETEERVKDYENQMKTLMQEHTKLIEEIEKRTIPLIQMTDNESQTEDHQYEKLTQMNNKLKRALQAFKDKIQRVVNERRDLFDGVGEDTNERFDHLISTVENQATQINALQAERAQVEEQLQNEIKQLENSLDTNQTEYREKVEQLSSQSKDYQKQIEQLQQCLSDKDNERNSYNARLNEVELELRKTIDDHALKSIKHDENLQSLIEERNILIEQKALSLEEHQRELEQLKKDNDQIREEIAILKQPIDSQDAESQTDEDINALNELLEQQKEQLQTLNEKCYSLSSQLDSNTALQAEVERQRNEIEEQINDYKNHLDNLLEERAHLLEEIEKKIIPSIETIDNESQTDDHEYEKLAQTNNKLKRTLQKFNDKIQKIVTERPDLFDGIHEDTSERLEHLISTVENQSKQINLRHSEHNDVEEQLRNEIKQLQSELETSENERDIERRETMERVSLQFAEYQKQIEQLQQSLLEKDNEFELLSAESQRKNDVQSNEELFLFKQSSIFQNVEIQTDENLKLLNDTIEQQSQELKDLNEKYVHLSSQLASQSELLREKKDIEERLNERDNQIENLIQERTNLLKEIEKKSVPLTQTTDNQSQTDDQQFEKLKHKLQTFKDKIRQIVTEKPDLFLGIGEAVSERLDHLILTVENQATQINVLRTQCDQTEKQLQNEIKQLQSSLEISENELHNERQEKLEQLSLQAKDYQKQIEELQQTLLKKDNEQISLNERFNQVELELKKTIDDHALMTTKHDALVEERNTIVQKTIHDTQESQQEIERLKQELNEAQRSPDSQDLELQTDEDIKALYETIDVQSQQIKDLNEKNTTLLSEIEFQTQFIKEMKEIEQQSIDDQKKIENLIQERTNLLEEIEKKTVSPIETIDNQSQTDDHQHEELVQMNETLKRSLQIFNDKIQQVLTEKPDLFDNIGEETSERVDHLIAAIENQARQVKELQTERNQIEQQLRNEIKQLQSDLETSENERDNERREMMEQSSSKFADYQKQIEELQQSLLGNDNERNSADYHLHEIELELKKAIDNLVLTTAKYDVLVEEHDAVLKKAAHDAQQSQQEIERLKQELTQAQQLPDSQDIELQTDEDIQLLNDTIEQQSQQIKELNEKYDNLSSQLASQIDLIEEKKEIEKQLFDHKNQIENLMQERANLLEEIQKNITIPIQTVNNEVQTEDQQTEKLVQTNNTLKHALHTLKDKIDRLATERIDLFDSISEETGERLNHLISTIENQAKQIDLLQAEREQVQEQHQREIKEMQNSLDAYQNQIEHERRTKIEPLLAASPDEEISSTTNKDYQKEIDQLQQNLSQKDEEQTLLQHRLNEVEIEFRKTLDDHTSIMNKYKSLEQEVHHSEQSQHEIQQLKDELTKLKQVPDYQHVEIQTDENNQIWNAMIEQLNDLNEKNSILISQLESQAEIDQQKKDIEERLNERENQIVNLIEERTKLLEEMNKNTLRSIQTIENEVQTVDDEHDKLLEINKSLKSRLETIENKIQYVITAKSDLFGDISKETNERLDHLISIIQNQEIQIDQLKNSFDNYRQQITEYISSLHRITHDIETQTQNQQFNRIDISQIESNTWFDLSSDTINKEEIKYQQYRDIDIQCELSLSTSNLNSSSLIKTTEDLKTKLHEILPEESILLSSLNDKPFEDLDQMISLIKHLQNEINKLQSSFDTYRNEIENERLKSHHVHTQTLGLSMFEEYEKQIKKFQENEFIYQHEIERLTEEKNQLKKEKPSSYEPSLNNNHNIINNHFQSDDDKRQNKPLKIDVEIQTIDNLDLLTLSDQSISRHIFEQEMLAWSNESEQLKRFVKQIQIENNKLKDIVRKFEHIMHDCMHENQRLKHENQYYSSNNDISIEKDSLLSSDDDICYLTLKWLTYEVAQKNQQSIILTNHFDKDINQSSNDTKQQMKILRVQNERLKNQLESYTIHFKHVQHEMSLKIREMSILKEDTERLRMNEIQSRLEIHRLKSELENDQLKIQQLEYQLADLKIKQTTNDMKSINNLREILELKERELNALKEKLDYTKQTHQIELQEAHKANQFSLDNVKSFQQTYLSQEEKRKELEIKLGKFCQITKPLINNQQLFIQNPIINIDELRKLIAEIDIDERITNSLSPIRDCLSLLEAQMKDLHHSIIENHARRSKRWKYKLGFECLSCESRWEVTHDIRDLQQACLDPSRFLETSLVEPMAGCSCPIMIDFIESDIRLCLDDIINDVIVRTTVN